MTQYYINLSVTRLHHAEFAQLLAHTLEDFKSANLKTKDEDATRLLNAIKTKLPTLQAALEQVRSSEKSQTIHELDKARDRAFTALNASIKPFRYATTDSEKHAYTALSLLFKHYKNVARVNFEEETALINNLLAKLKSDEYLDDVATLGIGRFVTALTTAQAAFEKQFNARSKETIAKVSYDVVQLRRELTQHYVLFIDYIGINAVVKSDTFYQNTLHIINNSRKSFADIIARRNSKHHHKHEEHPTPTSDTTDE